MEVRQPPSYLGAVPAKQRAGCPAPQGMVNGPYLTMPFSLSHPAAASLALCFWSPLTARLRLMRSSVVRVLDTLFRASLALSVILALLKRGSTCCALKLFLGSSSTTRSLSAMDGVVV